LRHTDITVDLFLFLLIILILNMTNLSKHRSRWYYYKDGVD